MSLPEIISGAITAAATTSAEFETEAGDLVLICGVDSNSGAVFTGATVNGEDASLIHEMNLPGVSHAAGLYYYVAPGAAADNVAVVTRTGGGTCQVGVAVFRGCDPVTPLGTGVEKTSNVLAPSFISCDVDPTNGLGFGVMTQDQNATDHVGGEGQDRLVENTPGSGASMAIDTKELDGDFSWDTNGICIMFAVGINGIAPGGGSPSSVPPAGSPGDSVAIV